MWNFEKRQVELSLNSLSDGRLYRGMERAIVWGENIGLLNSMSPKDKAKLIRQRTFLVNDDGYVGLVARSGLNKKNGSSGHENIHCNTGVWLKDDVVDVVLEAGKEVFNTPDAVLSDMGITMRLVLLPGDIYYSQFTLFSETAKRRLSLGTDMATGQTYAVERINGGAPRSYLKDGRWGDGAEEFVSFWNINPNLLVRASYFDFQGVFVRFVRELLDENIGYNEVMVWFNRFLKREMANG